MTHELKIKQCYLIHIVQGIKSFEVRKNDRDFQVGDTIKFLPIADDNYNAKDYGFQYQLYQITYVHTDLGMQDNYVVLGIKPLDKELKNDS